MVRTAGGRRVGWKFGTFRVDNCWESPEPRQSWAQLRRRRLNWPNTRYTGCAALIVNWAANTESRRPARSGRTSRRYEPDLTARTISSGVAWRVSSRCLSGIACTCWMKCVAWLKAPVSHSKRQWHAAYEGNCPAHLLMKAARHTLLDGRAQRGARSLPARMRTWDRT